jgi:phosphatidyl-myo-inositol alpha-mannosyltransferase
MKIGFVTSHSFINPGGVKRHILGLQKEFGKRGIESKIIVPKRKRREKYGKDVIFLGRSFPMNLAGTQADFCLALNRFAMKRILKKEKFDVLHFHNFALPSSVQLLDKSKCLNIMTLHANFEKSGFMKKFPNFLKFITKIVQWKMDGVIGVSPINIRAAKGYKGLKAVIPNGIDLEEFNPSVGKIKKYRDGKINILFLGRIEERKGLIYLLKAVRDLNKKQSNLRLIVAGSGPLEKDCRAWARSNKLKNVVFEGEIKEKDVPSYYATCDIFCSPAIYGESFGIVLVEAMATGKPVVAFNNKGYRGVLGKGKGKRFLAKNRDHKDLARKLEALIKDVKLREGMGQWGIREAEKYSWPKIADEVLSFYELCFQDKLKREALGKNKKE